MLDYMQKGGPLMWLIFFCSIASVALFLERLIYLRRASLDVGEFLEGLANLVRHQNFAEARAECQAISVPVTRVIHSTLSRHSLPRAELREIAQEAGQLEVPRLEQNLGLLIAIGYLCPLVGLLGTVTGLIQVFVQISASNGYPTLAEVSGGIYQALLTTAAGLAVAIPTILGYCHLSARVNTILHDMERAGIEVINLLAETASESSIIEFDPGATAAGEHR